ncbi:MAG: hypothetical protein IPN97_04585 [Saprospiraceae bacterium]|nr:hypothetical protein [Saprospiraceae bacterium]
MYDIECSSKNNGYETDKSIHISSYIGKNCGFRLLTKHSPGKAYFFSNGGNNIKLNNITVETVEHYRGEKPKNENFYFARSDYSSINPNCKPSFDYFIIDSCKILGSVAFSYGLSSNNTTPHEMLTSGIKNIEIKKIILLKNQTLLELSNGK